MELEEEFKLAMSKLSAVKQSALNISDDRYESLSSDVVGFIRAVEDCDLRDMLHRMSAVSSPLSRIFRLQSNESEDVRNDTIDAIVDLEFTLKNIAEEKCKCMFKR